MTLGSSVTDIKGVGETLSKKFAVLGIKTVADVINYFPRRYDDYSTPAPISTLSPGKVSIQAEIKQVKGRYVRRGMHITEAIASDDSGSLRLVWFNQPYRATYLKTNQKYLITGVFELKRQHFSLTNPSVELASDLNADKSHILAVYRETKGLNSRQIRQVVAKILDLANDLAENLPDWIIKQHNLMSHSQALINLHEPESNRDLEEARRRLGFEEVFALSLASLLNKQENQKEHSVPIEFKPKLAKRFSSSLPFKLTDAQRISVMRVYKDLEKDHPMNRLIEGDVGSGKTVVAAMAALMAMSQGFQVALMAPTEILAHQHADSLHKLMNPIGYNGSILLLVGGMTPEQKAKAHKAIKEAKAGFIIGTHALIQEKVNMTKLALVIIDEQHRFGVEQRKKLMAKAGHMPHVLSLTATPIPRTLALTLYGELDISILDEKPEGRIPIETKVISPNARKQLNSEIDKQLELGRQMFVVCPLISDSSLIESQSVEAVYEKLSKVDFKHRRVGLLHGQMKSAEKQSIMQKFIDHKLDILVSTTVIEVGVDVPNATIMLIESAERFGLAQLHQLRGRVGRGGDQSYCYLMLDDSKAPTRRLRAMESTNDGFKLAELDLELRGPGAIYGFSQHGELDLRIAQLSDTKLIATARNSAQAFIDKKENLLQYKELSKTVNRLRSVTNLN